MRIAEYKQVDTKTEQRVIHHPAIEGIDESGNTIQSVIALAYDETIEVEVPVMGMVYRDMTPEEIAEMEREQANMPEPEPTAEEQIAELREQNAMLLECLLEMSEIVYA